VPQIRIFRPGENADDIFRFRYKIYEEEMRRNDSYADHERYTISDPLDEFSYNIIAYEGAETVGVVRVTFCADGDPGFYREFFDLDGVGADYPEKVTFSTRLMVDPKKRRGMLPVMLSAECFKLAIERNTIWSFCDCNPPLVPFFERLHFESQGTKHHPTYGEVVIMRINLENPEIYNKKKSIIARFLDC